MVGNLSKINKLLERFLRIVHNGNTLSHEELLESNNSVSNHTQNLQALATELYKFVNGFSPDVMKDVFPFNTSSIYNTRTGPIKIVYFGSETLSYLGLEILELVPDESKA